MNFNRSFLSTEGAIPNISAQGPMASFVCTIKRKRPRQLQDVCCTVIAKNFEVLIKCGTRRDIEYLLRKSQDLVEKFREVYDRWSIPLNPSLFCISKYLKELDLGWFERNDVVFVLDKLKTFENNLLSISVPRFSLLLENRQKFFDLLPATLEYLYLQCYVDKNDLKIIAESCPRLKELGLHLCFLSIDSIVAEALCRHKNKKGDSCPNLALQKLDICKADVSKECINFIMKNCPNLSEIRHHHVNEVVYDKYREFASSSPSSNVDALNLKFLCAKSTYISCYRILNAYSVLCPNITTLDVCIKNEFELDICEEFALLREVRFELHIPCDCLSFLKAQGKRLRSLSICSLSLFCVSSKILAKCCPLLEYLCLGGPKFLEVSSVARKLKYILPNLEKLIIKSAHTENLEESVLDFIARSPNLNEVLLDNCKEFYTGYIPNFNVMYQEVSAYRYYSGDSSIWDLNHDSEEYDSEMNESEEYDSEIDESGEYDSEMDESAEYDSEISESEEYDSEMAESEEYDLETYDSDVTESEENDLETCDSEEIIEDDNSE